ncbi:hypothetical protein JKY72_04760 [Candidatus Gracilibacteria bacterium]|nr:hypothetical protein [Candidatus Gracilibacteria bacterium]
MSARLQVNFVDQKQAKINLVVAETMKEMRPLLKGWLVKQLVKKVKKRFERDEIDAGELEYIIETLVHDMGSSEEILEGKMMEAKRKRKADQIIFDIKAVMNGNVAATLLKMFGVEDAKQGVRHLQENVQRAHLSQDSTPDVAAILWEIIKSEL